MEAGIGFNNPSLEALAEIRDINRERQNNKIQLIDDLTGKVVRRQTEEHSEHESGNYQNPGESIAVFVSIGFGKPTSSDLCASNTTSSLKNFRDVYQSPARTTWKCAEQTHEEAQRATWGTNTAYYRFNPGEGIGHIKIDEWERRTDEGKPVNKTLQRIEFETKRYLEEPETNDYIRSCAKKLVQLRRKQL